MLSPLLLRAGRGGGETRLHSPDFVLLGAGGLGWGFFLLSFLIPTTFVKDYLATYCCGV